MKVRAFLLTVALGSLFGTNAVFAEKSAEKKDGPKQAPDRIEERFKALDTNKDGVLSLEEFKKGVEQFKAAMKAHPQGDKKPGCKPDHKPGWDWSAYHHGCDWGHGSWGCQWGRPSCGCQWGHRHWGRHHRGWGRHECRRGGHRGHHHRGCHSCCQQHGSCYGCERKGCPPCGMKECPKGETRACPEGDHKECHKGEKKECHKGDKPACAKEKKADCAKAEKPTCAKVEKKECPKAEKKEVAKVEKKAPVKVEKKEIAKAEKKDLPKRPHMSAEERFKQLDANKDGTVSEAEFVASHKKLPEPKAKEIYKAMGGTDKGLTLEQFKKAREAFHKKMAEQKAKT